MEIKFGTTYRNKKGQKMVILDPGENGHFEASLITDDGAIHSLGTLDAGDIGDVQEQINLAQVVEGRKKYFQVEIKHPMPKTQSTLLKELSTRPPQTL